MSEHTVEATVMILNKMGLHARPASQLARLATQFEATITVHQADKSADALSNDGRNRCCGNINEIITNQDHAN